MATPASGLLRTDRRRRGTPEATHDRRVTAAAELFDREGFAATDAGRISRAAGYAVGTFYKHFADKREILLAAYGHWVDTERRDVERELRPSGSARDVTERVVRLVLRLHVRWRGLRMALTALVASDADARRFHRAQRRRVERVCDAIATGELRDLGLGRDRALGVLRDQAARAIERR